RLAIDFGEWFGENFKGFIRLNLATDPKIVKQAVENIITEYKKIK
ncbi:aminotransferase, partial [Fusobacterium simiae]|nr:aminotransferase [Fusobacterium simiae]